MANVPKEDYEKIANLYNESGDKATMEYIGENYGIKAPSIDLQLKVTSLLQIKLTP